MATSTSPFDANRQFKQFACSDCSDILEYAPIGIFISTPEGRFLAANHAMANMYGYESADDIVNAVNDISMQIYAESGNRKRLFDLLVSQDSIIGYESEHKRKDGTSFWTSESVHVVRDQDGTIRHIQGFVTDISSRKVAELTARVSDKRFKDVFINAPTPYHSLDADGIFLDVNQAFLDVLGYSKEELIGNNFTMILTPKGFELFRTEFPRFKSLNESQSFEFELVKKDGMRILSTVTWSVQRDELGDFQMALCVLQDISLSKRIERAMRAAAECATALSGSEEISIRLGEVVDILNNTTGFSRSYIFQNIDVEGGGLCMKQIHEACAPGISPQLDNLELQSLSYEDASPALFDTLTNKQPYTRIVGDLAGREREVLEAQGIRAILILPVFSGDVFWGFLGLDDCVNDRQWRDDEIALLQTVANAIGLAIKRDEYEKALTENQARLTLAMDLADMVSWELDIATGTFTFGERFYSLYGTSAEREGGHRMTVQAYATQFVHPEDAWMVADEVDKLFKADEPDYAAQLEHRIVRRDGEIRHIVVRYRLIRDEMGRPVKTFGANQDITDRKRTEEALRESELRFKTLHNASFGGIAIHDKGIILDCNQGLSEVSGYSQEELVGMDGLLLIAERSRSEVMRNIRNAYEKPYEVFGVKKNGEEYPLQLEARNIPYQGRMVRTVEFRDISERKQAEANLVRSELRLRTLRDCIPDLVWLKNTDGVYLSCNPPFERFLGCKEEQILGKSDNDFFAPSLAEFYRDNDRRAIEADGPRMNEEVLTFVQDGYQGLFETIKTPVRDEAGAIIGVLGVARDITERKMAEEALRESEERFKALHNASFGGIAIHDKGVILECNLGLSEMFGYARDELIGMDGLLLVAERSRDVVMSHIIAGYEKPYEEYGRRKNGDEFPMRLEARNIPYKGKMVRAVEFRDITDSEKAAQALLAAKEAAESATRAKSEFLANMSHEVRTPLNGVLGMLQLLQTTEQTDEQKEYILGAIKSTKRLTRLLADILDISKIEAGKLQVIEAEFSTACLQESILEIFRPTAREKNLAFDFYVDAQMPPMLIGDETRVRQILFNLVGNALKFTENGSVLVDAMALPATGSGSVRVLFAVSDTGIGISDEQLKDIFEPFVQGERSYTRCYQGAGLGLAIVRKLVQILGGAMVLDNTAGNGTTVYVSLPFKLPAPHQEPASLQSRHADQPAEPPLRVLLVEDDEFSLFAGKRMLHKMGYSVTTAPDGREALAIMHEHDFDLVIMDIQMPVMDGVEATKAIRGADLGEKSHIPIIAMTAYAMAGDKERFLAAGMDGYISKPVDRDELKAVIEKVREKTSWSA